MSKAMTAKQKQTGKPAVEQLKRKSVELILRKDQTPKEMALDYARLAVSPELAAQRVICSADSQGGNSAIWEGIDVPSLTDELRAQAAAVNRGKLDHVEAMLMNQATGLQSLYARLTERAMVQEHMQFFEGYMRMALRAQNQCRATLETLAAIKNPPVVFAKQANINHGNGNQQVNNGTPATHAGKNINPPNELLEVQHGSETLDTRTTGATIGKDKAWQPWTRSTGAQTRRGKAASSRNAYKGGWRTELRELAARLRGQREELKRF